MQKLTLQAEPRTIIGKKVRTLRRAGLFPGIIYGHNFEPITVQVEVKDFEQIYKEAGQSTVVYLAIDGQDYPTIIHDVELDPLTDAVRHADFYKVRLDEKITANIAVVFVGESSAVKDFGGILVKNINELEVEALPQDLPHEITVDISALKKIGGHIAVADLKLGSKVEIKANKEEIIALIQEPISEEELKSALETPAVGSAEEVEVIKKEKTEEEVAEESAE